MAEQWFVVRTKPAKETVAAVALAAEGFQALLPVDIVEVSHAGKRTRKERPLFPRYIFTRFDREATSFGKINYCRGVASKGLMCDAMDRPIAVRDSIIERIKDKERLLRAKIGEVTSGWRPGDKFLLKRGQYAEMEATYIGEENGEILVTVSLFGRAFLVPLGFDAVPICPNLIDKISA